MLLRVRPGTDQPKRHALVEDWYREQIKKAVPPLLARWQLLMGVRVERFFVQRMKTKWGAATTRDGRFASTLSSPKSRLSASNTSLCMSGSLAGADAQCPVHRVYGSIHAGMASQSGRVKPRTASRRELAVLSGWIELTARRVGGSVAEAKYKARELVGSPGAMWEDC